MKNKKKPHQLLLSSFLNPSAVHWMLTTAVKKQTWEQKVVPGSSSTIPHYWMLP